MPRRPALAPALAALCAATTLTACQGSPEAGHPNTTPTSSSSTPSSTSSTPSTLVWTTEQRAAITAAQARYSAARGAVTKAFQNPRGAQRETLEAAGNGGAWLASILERLVFLKEHSLYQDGGGRIVSTSPISVDLTAEQPSVILKSCIDGAGVQMRYQTTGKPVPVATTVGGGRSGVSARFVYASGSTGAKMWFLVEEKSAAAC